MPLEKILKPPCKHLENKNFGPTEVPVGSICFIEEGMELQDYAKYLENTKNILDIQISNN
jgi:hypothetical protein